MNLAKLIPALSLLLAVFPPGLRAEPRTLPAGRGVVDVTLPPYSAVPDGKTDCTDALQRALRENLGRTIYLPAGTYLISGTVRWPAGERDTTLWGEARDRTIIRLADATPGFTQPEAPLALIWTGQKPAQRFKNYIRHLTVETGRGNPGAIGVQFIANNSGAVRDVCIRSGDGAGVIGLDLGYTDEQGPCLIKDVRIEGFGTGISLDHQVDSVTMEDVTVVGARVMAVRNHGQVLSVRRLRTEGVPLAVENRGNAVLTLVDCSLDGSGPAAITTEDPAQLFLRDVQARGFHAVLAGHPSPVAELASPAGIALDGNSPARSLRLPVEETPDVPWGSPGEWVSVEAFGAVAALTPGRPAQDSTAAFQAAIDSGARTLYVPEGFYRVDGEVIIRGKVERMVGLCQRAVIIGQGRFVLGDGAAPVVVFETLQGLAGGVVARSGRTFVFRHLALQALGWGDRSSGFVSESAGRYFFEDVVVRRMTFSPNSRAWARQLNTENLDTKITATGSDLWILGLKCERGGTLVDARGGRTEVLGTFEYTTTDPGPNPMFVVRDGLLSVTFGEACFNRKPFDVLVRATLQGVTRELKRSDLPARSPGSAAALVSVRPP
jgi:hypothetical protein